MEEYVDHGRNSGTRINAYTRIEKEKSCFVVYQHKRRKKEILNINQKL